MFYSLDIDLLNQNCNRVGNWTFDSAKWYLSSSRFICLSLLTMLSTHTQKIATIEWNTIFAMKKTRTTSNCVVCRLFVFPSELCGLSFYPRKLFPPKKKPCCCSVHPFHYVPFLASFQALEFVLCYARNFLFVTSLVVVPFWHFTHHIFFTQIYFQLVCDLVSKTTINRINVAHILCVLVAIVISISSK